jgi:hypothetical protein
VYVESVVRGRGVHSHMHMAIGSPRAYLGDRRQLSSEVHNVEAPAVSRLHQAACLASTHIHRHRGTARGRLPKLGAGGGPLHTQLQLALWVELCVKLGVKVQETRAERQVSLGGGFVGGYMTARQARV